MIRKSFFWLLATVLLTTVLPAEAQQPKKIPQIGFFGIGSPSATAPLAGAFRQGLNQLGYVEAKNIQIEYRYAQGQVARVPALIDELVRLKVDVLVIGSLSGQQAAKKATSTISIVMAQSNDPVRDGLIASLARPGGNITGLTTITDELSGKRLELFKEAVPRVSRVAVLWGGSGLVPATEIESTARALGIQIQVMRVRRQDAFDNAFEAIAKERADALLITRGPVIRTYATRIRDFADKKRLPTMYDDKRFVEGGGLMSYGTDILDLYQRSATYVDKILKGTKPADLPVEQPVRFEFVVNLKTAKDIGVTIPQWTLMKADRVIR